MWAAVMAAAATAAAAVATPAAGTAAAAVATPTAATAVSSMSTAAQVESGARYKAVAAGSTVSCAIRTGGSMGCWRTYEDAFGESEEPGRVFVSVSAGDRQTCGLQADGAIFCWGYYPIKNHFQSAREYRPERFAAVSAGRDYGCGVLTEEHEQALICWGPRRRSGEAGHVRFHPPPGSFTSVAAGRAHACAIGGDDSLTCWGANRSGQTDVPDSAGAPSPHSIWDRVRLGHLSSRNRTIEAVAAGRAHTCALRTDHTVLCWGDDEHGQAAAPGGTFKSISVRDDRSCGLRPDGSVVCWGDVRDWQKPRDWDDPPGTYEAIAVGGEYVCGLGGDGEVDCGFEWLTLPAPRGPFTAIAAGASHVCGLRTDGTIKCWDDPSETISAATATG